MDDRREWRKGLVERMQFPKERELLAPRNCVWEHTPILFKCAHFWDSWAHSEVYICSLDWFLGEACR